MMIHGSRSMYGKGACRCTRCYAAERAYQRQYYHRWKTTRAGLAWRARQKLRLLRLAP